MLHLVILDFLQLYTESQITNLDKYTQAEVDALTWTESDITDLDKYTQAEVDTISNGLQSDIDGKASTIHTHTESQITDLDKYTKTEVDVISNGLQSNIDGKASTFHSELNQLDYNSSGHTGFASQEQINELLLAQEQINELLLALKENNIYVGEITFNTSGQTFAPVIILSDAATVLWTFSDGTTSDSATPSKDFGTAGNRVQRLKVTPWSNVYRINTGYNGADGGAGDIEHVTQQNITSINNLYLVADTLVDFCGNENPITNINFNNFLSLDTIELYESSIETITIKNTPAIHRLSVERTGISVLDLSESPNLEDVRASNNPFTSVNWGTGAFNNLWHVCMHSSSSTYTTPFPTAENMPNIQDFYISRTNQTGVGVFNNLTSLTDTRFNDNSFTSLDFTNSFAINSILRAYNNVLTSIDLTGCSGLSYINLSNNNFNQTNIDYILTTVDTLENLNGTIDLTGGNNSYPSSTGVAAIASLEGKGWTCSCVSPPEGGSPILNTATIGANGTYWTFEFDKNVRFGSGGSGGFAVAMTSGGVINLTYVSGENTNSLIYSGSSTVTYGDTVSSGLDYTQPGNGIEETNLGDDLLSLNGHAVINNVSDGGDPISFVNSCSSDFGAYTGPTPNLNFVVGNVVVVEAASFGTSLHPVTDTLGNTYQLLDSTTVGDMHHNWYYCVVTSGGDGTISAEPVDAPNSSINVMQFANVDTVSPLGASIVGERNMDSVAITTTNAGDVVLFGAHVESNSITSYATIPTVGPIIEIENCAHGKGRPMGYWITTEAQTATEVGCIPDTSSMYSVVALSLKRG
jgi:hypothetical protein